LHIAAESGSPSMNLIVGDHEGKVGWTIAGRLPRRVGQAGSQVVSWADGANGWNGWLTAGEHPRLGSPAIGRVFSGNQRKLGSEAYLTLATMHARLGARARQIGDALAVLTNATAADMLAIQLDDRALLLEPWRELLLATLRHPNSGGGGSQRLVVSPGHEDQGLLHMFGGQSGHFLSPYYRAGHDAWVRGEPKPLLPGAARHTLRLHNLPNP
jgi:acyl-homoserine lactone acylase PvdQ